MHIGPQKPNGLQKPATKPATKPKPSKKPQVATDQPTTEAPEKHIAKRKIRKPHPPKKTTISPAEESIYDQPSEPSCHYAVSPILFSRKKNGVNKQLVTTNNRATSPQHVNKLNQIYGNADPKINGAKPAVEEDFTTRLSTAALVQLLAKRNSIDGVRKLLDACTPEQRMALNKEKKFPRPWYAALNRRLLADALTGFISAEHNGLFFRSESKKLINSAATNFHARHLAKEVLDNPIAVSHLFRHLQSRHPVFNEVAFNRLSRAIIAGKDDQVPEMLVKELQQALQKMPTDEKDHFLVSIRIMMAAYRNTRKNDPEQSEFHKQPRFQLAAMFAQSVFEIPSNLNLSYTSVEEIKAAKEQAQLQYLQAGYLMQILLLPGL